MTTMVDIRLLGGFQVAVGGVAIPTDAWRRRHAAALVKLLALAPGRTLHREQVLDALWPDEDPALSAPRLHKAAHFVRRATSQRDAVVLDGHHVSLFPAAVVQVDAVVFERLAVAGDLVAAIEVCGGDLLPADPYEPWLDAARLHLRRLRLDVLRAAGRWPELLAVEPSDEEAHLAVMRAHLAAGRRAAVLQQFDRLRVAVDELGIEPGPDAVALRDLALDDGLLQDGEPAAFGPPRRSDGHRPRRRPSARRCRIAGDLRAGRGHR